MIMTQSIAVNAPPKKRRKRHTTAVSESVFRQRTLPYSEAHKKKPQPPKSHQSVIAIYLSRKNNANNMLSVFQVFIDFAVVIKKLLLNFAMK